MPPEHGAAVACHVFDTRAIWEEELNSMRARVQSLRQQLADALAAIDADPAFQALRHHQGMFSLLPLAPDQMESLRCDHAIYGTATGRINIAGLRCTQVEQVAAALRDVSQA
jgi:aspartate aminotransferase